MLCFKTDRLFQCAKIAGWSHYVKVRKGGMAILLDEAVGSTDVAIATREPSREKKRRKARNQQMTRSRKKKKDKRRFKVRKCREKR